MEADGMTEILNILHNFSTSALVVRMHVWEDFKGRCGVIVRYMHCSASDTVRLCLLKGNQRKDLYFSKFPKLLNKTPPFPTVPQDKWSNVEHVSPFRMASIMNTSLHFSLRQSKDVNGWCFTAMYFEEEMQEQAGMRRL